MTSAPAHPLDAIIRPPSVTPLPTFGGQLDFHLTGAQTGGWLTAALFTAPPENGPPIHLHHREDEILIVLEGRFTFYSDGTWTEAGPGTTVFLPRGKPHAFKNIGTTDGKLYVLANPSGLETFFPRCEKPFHRPEGPDMEAITAIAADHGIEFLKDFSGRTVE